MKKNILSLIDKKFWSENKWIITAVLFFIIWKFFLIGIFLQNGIHIPESKDDIASYVRQIESVRNCSNLLFCDNDYTLDKYSGWEHLTYRLILGSLAKVFSLSPYQAFEAGFYVGTVMLSTVLVFLTQQLTDNKKLTSIALFFLAMFNGAGTYHGFYWVVPSFFALLFFLLILSSLLGKNKNWKFIVFVSVPAMLYSHTIGAYFSIILIVFYFFYSLFSKKIDRELLKKIFLTLLLIFIFYSIPLFFYSDNPYGPLNLLMKSNSQIALSEDYAFQDKSENIITSETFPGMTFLYRDYLKFMFPHWLVIPVFLFFLILLGHHKEHKILAIFLAAFSFTILSSVNYYAFRSLIFLWPMTYLLAAFFTFYGIKFINEICPIQSRKILLGGVALFIVFFIFFNFRYSIIINQKQAVDLSEIFFQ